uniref:Spindle and kinetochore-associated protein 3 n=1 Tax=Heterorhabditis bacteriophora TaxID=37862 RepID=A0A1I7WYV2_HETBA
MHSVEIMVENTAICDLANMENLEDIKENRDSIFNNCSEILDHCRSNSSENFQLLLNNSNTNMSTSLGLINSLFTLHQSISIDVGKVCKDGEEKEVNENIDFQYYRDKYGSFGFDVETLDITIEELLHFMNNTDHLDNIMRSFDQMSLVGERPFPSTHILPYLKKIKYDSRWFSMLHLTSFIFHLEV